ncbi:LutC/YkgG family protein [Gimesia fumaroli]|uniref:Lactate utilization protein C n=1 Tax=Gimesia fumaroli TaxID=2527976 RepID=A0A518I4J5_9PLAN|nr:LUD domain-containing protein [Gimesia fumaroli]QDV48020.1 Lactate utilization protein C [Gimesia fumaroli]
MTTSRDEILNRLRSQSVPKTERPDLSAPELTQQWISYDDPAEQFATMLASVGGVCARVKNVDEVNQKLSEIPAYQESKKICSQISNCGTANVEISNVTDPHDFEDIDFAILPGEFAVAENGAVWITNDGGPARTLYFLSQHVALLVPAAEVVQHMHAAYERLSFETPSFGTFMSGPSKTADIEQSLVIGAHGARSLTVFLVENAF